MAGGRFFELSEERLELLRARRRAAGLETGDDSIPRRPAGEAPPPSFSQERLWFLDRLAGGDAHLAIPAPLLLTGTLDRRALARALADVVARHEPLRSTFPEPSGEKASAGDGVRVEVTPPAEAFRRHLRLPGADISTLPPARRRPETERLAGRIAGSAFDLARGPLLVSLLLDLGMEAVGEDAGVEGGEAPSHALLLAVHHVAADGWSLGVLFGDLARAYDAHRRPGPGGDPPAPTLGEPAVRYGDWAAWQRRRLSGERLAGEVEWWRRRLAGAPRVLALPADRPPGPGEGFRGGSVRGAFEPALADRLRALGRGLPDGEASPFMTLLALLALLLARWTGEDDLVVGTPVAGRTRRETEGLVGLFLNHLVLRVGVRREAGFRDLLAAARDSALGAFAHQEVPFERLLEELEVPRDLATTPLFQVFLNLLSFPPPAPFGGGELEVSALAPARAPARFDLTLYADDRGPGGPLRLTLVYDARRFDAARMEEALRQLTALAEQVVAEPGRPVGTLSLVTAVARRALPDPGRRQDRSWPGPVHAAVDRHAAERPEAVAVIGQDGEAVTYRRLAAASRSLAAELRRRGVGRGDVVAVHAHREAALVAAVLAIHRAGAAFLLLDPAYPAARNALCCELASPAAVLDLDGAPAVPAEAREAVGEAPVMELGRLGETGSWVAEGAARGLPEVGPDDLAYVAFTSGSTGEPKGVLGLHRSLTHFLPWQEETFSLGPGDRFSLLSGLAHDPLQRDLFTPLWVGGAVAIPDGERFGEPGYLAGWLARAGVTVIHGTPSLLRLVGTGVRRAGGTAGGDGGWGPSDPSSLLHVPGSEGPQPRHRGRPPERRGDRDGAPRREGDEGSHLGAGSPGKEGEVGEAWDSGSPDELFPLLMGGGPGGAGWSVERQAPNLPDLRWAFLVGEALRGEDLERLRRLAPGALAVNLYGATETQRAVGWHAVMGRVGSAEVVPLGRGMPDVQLLVLQPAGGLAGVGEAGEVCVRSPHLAAGYLGRPGETAAAFVPDPCGAAGERIYRTGDLGRYRPDGVVQPLGRRDRQVKVRGFRVEPAEVEAVMAAHPAVDEAAVVAVGEASDARLAGYWTERDGEAVDAGELRTHLAARLPAAMVPADLVRLEALPRTPNGKIDRAALSAVEDAGAAGIDAHTPPATPSEELLAGLWREVLGSGPRTRRLDREDDFFAVGGHSLALTRLLARVRAAFGVDLPVRRAFETPTLAGQAAAIDELVRRGSVAVEPPRPRDRAADPPPASFAQRRLWFLDRLAPGRAAYTLSSAVDLRGDLVPAALAAALTTLARRHEALRTTLPAPRGEPVQRVAPAAAVRVALPLADLAALPEDRRRSEAGRLGAAAGRRRFDLARGPLLAAHLLRIGTAKDSGEPVHRLLLEVHHAVADGWSLGVMARELGALYTAALEEIASMDELAPGEEGRAGPARSRYDLARRAGLPDLPVQYADWSLWQRRLLSGPALEEQVAWWRRELEGLPPALELPTDRPRGAREDHRGASIEHPLPPDLVAAMERLAQRHGVTRYMLLLAALAVVLSRWSGQLDLAVGSPESGRGPREVEPLVGLFLNLLVLRVDLTGEPTFGELLARVRRRVLGAFAHRDVPFERLLEELAPARDPARPPLVEVLLNVLDVPADATAFAGLDARLAPPVEREARFPLSLYAWGGSAAGTGGDPPLVLRLVYQRALFDRGRMEELLGQLVALLEGAVEEPERPVALVGGLTALGRRVLADPAEEIAVPEVVGVVEAFGRVVERWGEREAVVVGGGGVWTYRELDAASGRAAEALTGAGLRRGEVVAVGGAPSFGLVSSILAVWRAGGVLLLLDPALPEARRAEMLRLAGAGWRMSAAGGEAGDQAAPGAAGSPAVRDLTFVEETGAVALEVRGSRPVGGEPRRFGPDVAYIVFTSGTSGRPKGVVGSHRGLGHFLSWQRESFGVGPGDRVAQLTALSFDVVLRDLLLPLTSGATLVLPADPALRLDPARVPAWLDAHGVTLLHAVPTLAGAWLTAGGSAGVDLAALRWIFFAGEPLPAALVEAWRLAFPGSQAAIANLYGPTETTLARCAHVVAEPPEPGVQPVGRALPDSQALVLAAAPDGSGGTAYRRCSPGEVGEIVLRTPLRSHGYLEEHPGSPFFPNPFRPEPPGSETSTTEASNTTPADLLYASGDLGRFRLDGTLEILGRRDAQVKVRGVRLEPAEVEAALAVHPTVAAAAVVVEGSGAAAHLVAWVVPAAGDVELEPRRLRAHLSRRLPAALVPSRFLPLDSLPTGATGKVDRAALPPVPAAEELAAGVPTAPRDDTEAALAEIFQAVLELPAVGVREGFFELGGHSLLAVPLLSRVEARFGRRLPLAALFTHPTVEELARLLRAAGAEAGAGGGAPSSSLVTLQDASGSPRPPLFLVHPGGGGVLCYADLAGALGPDQPVHALQSAGLDGGEAPLASIDAMAERYLADVAYVHPGGPYHLAGWSFGGRVVFEMARRLAATGEEVGLVALLDITPDPSPGPAHLRDEDDAALMARALAETFPVAADELRGLDHRRQVDRLLAAAREKAAAAGRPMPEIDPGRAEALLAVFKANLAAARAFHQRPYPGPVLLLRAASSDRFATPADAHSDGDPTGGWGELADSVRVVTVPGDHHSMVRPPHVAHLAAALRQALDAHPSPIPP